MADKVYSLVVNDNENFSHLTNSRIVLAKVVVHRFHLKVLSSKN